MRRHKKARLRAFLLLTTIAIVGGYFSLQRLAVLFQPSAPPPPAPSGDVLARWAFDSPSALKNWEEKVFKGKTAFEIVPADGGYLRIASHDACSGLYVKVETAEMSGLELRWKWRAMAFPLKKKNVLSNRSEDDFAARVYVIFPANNLFHSDVIEYVWDRSLPVGTSAESPYSDRILLLVLQSGGEGGEWREEKRDVYEDYRKLFGREPKRAIGMIALMSDSDSTGTSAAADFGALELTKKEAL